jgi:hypothetical protein
MKYLIIITIIALSLTASAQPKMPLNFQIKENANVKIGTSWDYTYQEMKTPMAVAFDGKTLKMTYTSGKVYFETPVLSFDTKKSTKDGKVSEVVYILKIERRGFINYIVLTAGYDIVYNWYYALEIPTVSKTGSTMAYDYYL